MYSVWSARDRFGSYKSIWQKIPLFPWMGVGLLFHFPSLLVLLFAALSSLSYRKRDIGWDTCVSTLDSFSYFMCFTCLKPPWSYHLENEQLLITLWDVKKTQYHDSNQSNISSAQGLRCVMILQKLLFIHGICTRYYSGHHHVTCTVEPYPYHSQKLGISPVLCTFCCHETPVVSGTTDEAEESQNTS